MIALPIPLVVSLILSFLALRLVLAGRRPLLLSALLGACAVQGLLVSLTQYYGLDELRAVQPVTAATIPPLAWLAFVAATLRPIRWRQDALHILTPLFTAFCVVFAAAALDVVLTTTFLAYGAAILWALRPGKELPLARLAADALPRRIWQTLASALLLSGLSDAVIAGLFFSDREGLVPLLISATSAAGLLAIGLVCLAPDASVETELETQAQETATPDDAALLARLEILMQKDRPWLDPDLTLARLARRLHVPVKQLSAAINRATGDNVSRYINAHRIRHACAALHAGHSVTEAMLASGFNTKSNFNREFRRVTGSVPSAFLQSRGT